MPQPLLRCLAAVLCITLLAALQAAAQTRPTPAPLFETPGLAAEALAAVVSRSGREPLAALIDIRGSEMIVHLEGARPHHIDRWTWIRGRGLFGTTTRIRGPEIAQPLVPSLDPTTVFFPIDGLPLDDLPALIGRIAPRAMLEEPAPPHSIRIERQLLLLLLRGASAGDARLVVHWNTGRESSYVHLDLDGSIRSANVAGTFRARGLDMARDDWHLPLAAEDFAFFEDFEGIRRVAIERRGINITYDDPQHPGQTTGMGWSLNGLKVNAPLVRIPNSRLYDTEAPFNYAEIDLAVLPALKAAALERVSEPGVEMVKLVASRPITGLGPPQTVWTLTLAAPGAIGNVLSPGTGEIWEVVASPAGEILRVIEPPSRRAAVEWHTARNIRDVLDRLGTSFPPDHPFHEIRIDPDRGRATALDGTDPALAREFAIDAHEIKPLGRPMRHDGVGEMWFKVTALDGYTAEVIDSLAHRTFDTIGEPGGRVSRLTFSRGNPWVRPPEGEVMLEIRVQAGFRGGRLTFLADGTELDRVLP
jgi:hypothetical protein